MTYENTCLTGVKYLLVFDPFYSATSGSLIPTFTDIVVDGAKSVSSASSAQSQLDGFDSAHRLGLTLENVQFDATRTTAQDAAVQTYDTNLAPSGTDVTVTPMSGSGSVPTCSFPAYPSL